MNTLMFSIDIAVESYIVSSEIKSHLAASMNIDQSAICVINDILEFPDLDDFKMIVIAYRLDTGYKQILKLHWYGEVDLKKYVEKICFSFGKKCLVPSDNNDDICEMELYSEGKISRVYLNEDLLEEDIYFIES